MTLSMPNGISEPQAKFIDGIDVNDPEYIRQLLRPPVIKEDVKLMEKRRRVSLILRSAAFRKELEKAVASQMKSGQLNANVLALKQIVDLLTPHTRYGSSTFATCATVPVVPINDLRSCEGVVYSKSERLIRCKLAAVYRLVDICGWNSSINNHITVRVTRDADEFLINPPGLLYHELTASSLVKINLEGQTLDPGCTKLAIDKSSWLFHAAVHEARKDMRCVIHLSTPATVAVSYTHSSLLPVSQEAMILGEVAFYDPAHLSIEVNHDVHENSLIGQDRRDAEEHKAIAKAFAAVSADCRVLMVRNHGILVLGKSVEEAWFMAFTAVSACESQLRLASLDINELVLPTKEAQDTAHHVGRNPAVVHLHGNATNATWQIGELEFEAAMRRLDAAGYRTGYIYRLNQVRQTAAVAVPASTDTTDAVGDRDTTVHARRAMSLSRGLKDGVEIPPAASSFATAYYGDDESRARAAAEAKAKTLSLSRTHWTNTPNVYLREEIEEIGTPNPKKIAHWTEGTDDEKRRTGGVAVPIMNPNQFAPQGKNPNEFKLHQQKVKEHYYKDTKTPGPKSRVLEGLDVDDFVDSAKFTAPSSTSPGGTLLRYDPSSPPAIEPGHVVVVGAASKGIIQRDQRHNAGLFQSVYSPNPFDRVTDDDLERYRENVDRKAKGLPSLEEEEAEARREEARRAAEIARNAMEAAARESAIQQQIEAQKASVAASGLSVQRPTMPRSDTSGAEASHDETEKEAKKDEPIEKKKKRRFKMPSFTRKGK